ncbi:hypothetical protein [Fictibacillus sp. S7]|uniref:hypothetical protein n=1 Tax=Fictibacillus sp. S7 TaxID=2212476 RepID=UPI001F51EB44|nr:hypothetical protein [Fictibacillus sp. S7]
MRKEEIYVFDIRFERTFTVRDVELFTGDTINCEVKIEEYKIKENNRTSIAAFFLCENQNGKEVLKGVFSGVIL